MHWHFLGRVHLNRCPSVFCRVTRLGDLVARRPALRLAVPSDEGSGVLLWLSG
jgi:hypothetical protein